MGIEKDNIVDIKFSATYEPDKNAFSDNESNETITSTNSNRNKSNDHRNTILNVGNVSNVIKMECDQCEQLFTTSENLFNHKCPMKKTEDSKLSSKSPSLMPTSRLPLFVLKTLKPKLTTGTPNLHRRHTYL